MPNKDSAGDDFAVPKRNEYAQFGRNKTVQKRRHRWRRAKPAAVSDAFANGIAQQRQANRFAKTTDARPTKV